MLPKELANPRNVKFHDLLKICTHYFGKPRKAGSHNTFPTPWGELLTIQSDGNTAKSYQVRQVRTAITRLMEAQSEVHD
ncbi:MAG: toxin HicA [Deltaproteobacteria bacterium]|nr:toxin HicA [Deltaproteobacteria bacterium]